jgi:integrase
MMTIPKLFNDEHWQHCLESFLWNIYQHSQSQPTANRYRQTLSRFFVDPQRPPDCYTRSEVEAFIRQPSQAKRCPGRPPAPGTMRDRLTIVSSFYRYSATYGITGEDGKVYPIMTTLSPAAGLRRPQEEIRYRGLTIEEIRRFFAAIPRDTVSGARAFALYSCYFFCCRRRSEIVGMRWMDIQESSSVGSGFVYFFHGKKAKGKRDSQELPGPAAAAIFEYLRVTGRLATIQGEDYIFTSTQSSRGPSRPICNLTVHRTAKEFAIKAGLDPEKVSCHVFRHSSAKLRYEQSHDILQVQAILRHSSLDQTYRYVQLLTGAADPGAEKLASRFGNL